MYGNRVSSNNESGYMLVGHDKELEDKNGYVFSRVNECTLIQCFAYGCVGICRERYFDSVRDYLLSGI